MYKIYILIFSVLIISCSPKIHYIGKSLPPTNYIEVFVSEQSIKVPFEYIGKGYIGGYGFYMNQDKIQKKAEQLGREKGADAVLIIDYYIPNTGGTNITSVFRTDSLGRGIVTTENTSIRPTTSSGYNILFLKYSK